MSPARESEDTGHVIDGYGKSPYPRMSHDHHRRLAVNATGTNVSTRLASWAETPTPSRDRGVRDRVKDDWTTVFADV